MRRTNLIGEKYGKLTVTESAGYGVDKDGKRYHLWKCICECGNSKIVNQHSLVTGGIKSCGCLRKRDYTQPTSNHGMSRTRIYHIYHGIKDRCLNENDMHYPEYGGRGICLCDEWQGKDGFLNFYKWSMNHDYDETLTIDRIDVNGNYEPDNCRWTSRSIQQMNKRNNARYVLYGEEYHINEIAEKYHISVNTLKGRLRKGLSIQDAVEYKKHELTYTYHGETKTIKEWSQITGISYSCLLYRLNSNYHEDRIFKPSIRSKQKGI